VLLLTKYLLALCLGDHFPLYAAECHPALAIETTSLIFHAPHTRSDHGQVPLSWSFTPESPHSSQDGGHDWWPRHESGARLSPSSADGRTRRALLAAPQITEDSQISVLTQSHASLSASVAGPQGSADARQRMEASPPASGEADPGRRAAGRRRLAVHGTCVD
jgi:hypothetical protein